MKIITSDPRLKEAVQWAEKYYASPEFRQDVLSVKNFEHSNVPSTEILALFGILEARGTTIEVKCTYFGWWYRNVLGRTVGNGFAYVNSSGLGRQIWSVAATVVHEVGHVVDEHFPKASFGHGSNSSKGKGKTFPYFIDERAETWIKKEVLKKEVNRLAIKQVALREVFA